MDGFVTAYSRTTGEQHRIPKHWLDNPVLGKDFTTTPPAEVSTETPKKSWSRERLAEHATAAGATFADDATKDDLLAAIAAVTPQTPDGAPLSDQTPA